MLPLYLFDVSGEFGLVVPALAFEELADVGLFGGWERARAVVVLVVAFAAVAMDEPVLNGTLQPTWHVVVHRCYAANHTDGLVAAVHRALLGLHLWIGHVDGCCHVWILSMAIANSVLR